MTNVKLRGMNILVTDNRYGCVRRMDRLCGWFFFFIVGMGALQVNGQSVNEPVCISLEEKKLFNMINAYRKSKRLTPIPFSSKLTRVAQAHVRDLEANYNYEAQSECNPHSWSDKGAWSGCCYTSDHQQAQCMWDKPREIAAYTGYGYEIAYFSSAGASAAEGLAGWKKSPGHNPLLVNSGTWKDVHWKAVGVAIYGKYGVVWFGEQLDDESTLLECK